MLAAVLALGLAWALRALLGRAPAGASRARAAFEAVSLWAFCAHALSWLSARGGLGSGRLALPMGPEEALVRAASGALLGALALGLGGRPEGGARRGLAAGLLAAVFGFSAQRWLCAAQAWRLLGWWSGEAVHFILPWLLAGALAAAAAFLLHEELKPWGLRLTAAVLFLWSGGADLALWRLRAVWGFGAATLSEEAGVPPASRAPSVAVATLLAAAGGRAQAQPRVIAVEGLDAAGESLERLQIHLHRRAYRTLFKDQGLRVLRGGWRLWWDADRALEADMMGRPGLAAPDYRAALSLIQAGPLTFDRYSSLEGLARLARDRREGFESVTQAQYIFEGFSAAYARFGSEEGARTWLLKVDDLWPVYEKRIEVSPLERFRDGRIAGSLLRDGRAARDLLVGLFRVPSSSGPVLSEGVLSGSRFPEEDGSFHFGDLGQGRYYLAVMGPAGSFESVGPSPGPLLLSEELPRLLLPVLRVEGP